MESDGKCRKTRVVFNTPGEAHELTWSCFHNRPFFKSTRCCQWFITSLELARTQYAFHVWAYVIMPTHVHLLLWPTVEDYKIETIAGSIKQGTSRRATNFLRKRNPHGLRQLATHDKSRPHMFWQDGGGYDRNMNTVEAIHASVLYIHNNPVRKGLVEHPEDWVWSSAAEWLNEGRGVVRIDKEFFPVLAT